VPSLISHVSWVGFNLATNNFIYDNVNVQKRGIAVSYYNMLWGVGIFLGAGLSAILIKFLKTSFIEPIILIFIIASIINMLVVFYWIPKLREVRKTQKFKGMNSVEAIIKKDFKPTVIQELHQMTSMGKYLHLK